MSVEYPLGLAQMKLWRAWLARPDSPAFVLRYTFDITGPLDPDRLARALQIAGRVHPGLTLALRADGANLGFHTLPEEGLRLRVQSEALDVAEVASRLQPQSFPQDGSPLIDALLVGEGSSFLRSRLVLSMHHIIADAHSLRLFFDTLCRAYQAGESDLGSRNSKPAVFGPADYPQTDPSEAMGLFEEIFRGWEGPSPLWPQAKLRRTVGCERHYFELENDAVRSLHRLAAEAKSTPFGVCAGLFAHGLMAAGFGNDVVFSYPMSARQLRDRHRFGYFFGELPVRIQVDPQESLVNLVRRVDEQRNRSESLGAFSFEAIRELDGNIWQDAARQVVSSVDFGRTLLRLPGISVTLVPEHPSVAQSDLILMCDLGRGGAHFAVEANSSAVGDGFAKSFAAECYATARAKLGVSGKVTSRPGALNLFERTSSPSHANLTPLRLQMMANKDPEAIAVFDDNQAITYEHLLRLVVGAADKISQSSVVQGDAVAVVLEHGDQQIVWQLAVLWLGGAIVPLSASDPPKRLDGLLKACQARVVITRRHGDLVESLGMVCIQPEWKEAAHWAEAVPVARRSSDHAYTIFTSGSTGSPKGVRVSHGSLTNLVDELGARFGVRRGTRVLAFAPPHVDAAIGDWAVALCAGASLRLLPEEGRSLAAEQAIREDQVDHVVLPPSVARSFDPETFLGLDTLVLAGEPIQDDAIERYPVKRLLNAYGPTEACVCASTNQLGGSGDPLSIGAPLNGVSYRVVNPCGEDARVGMGGELWISGKGLALGYLDDTQLTGERFIEENGVRWYRTGDIGRKLDDGTVAITGRLDNQIKISGFRFEPAEALRALETYPDVNEAVVSPFEGGFAAWIVSSTSVEIPVLQSFLQDHLPSFAVPTIIHQIESIPKSDWGKTDYAALRGLIKDREELRSEDESQSRLSKMLGVVGDVLGLERAARLEENFFELGGDSISGVRLLSRWREQGVDLSLNALFESDSLKELLSRDSHTELEEEFVDTAETSLSPIERQSDTPLLPIQKWFFAQDFPFPNHYLQIVEYSASSGVSRDLVGSALSQVLDSHEALRTTFFQNDEGAWMGRLSPQSPTISISEIDGEQIVDWGEYRLNLLQQIDIRSGPLLACWIERRPSASTVVFAVHHLAIDAVSWDRFTRDFSRALEGVGPTPSPSYREFALALAATAAWEEVQATAEFWMKQICGSSLERTTTPRERRIVIDGEVDDMTSQKLRSAGQRFLGVHLGAFTHSLNGMTERSSFTIDLERNGRRGIGVDPGDVIGWLTCLHPLKIRTESSSIFDAIAMVEDSIQEAPHDGMSYSLLAAKGELPPSPAEIVFSHMGMSMAGNDSGWKMVLEQSVHPGNPGHYFFEVTLWNEYGTDGGLTTKIRFDADPERYDLQFLSRAMDRFVDSLQAAASTLSSPQSSTLVPLFPHQRGLFAHSARCGSEDPHINQTKYRCPGNLNIKALEKAWNVVVQAHGVLRLSFRLDEEGVPIGNQAVEVSASVRVVRLSDRSEEEAVSAGEREFLDLSKAPVARLMVLHGEEESILVLTHHQIVFDGWSGAIIFDDLFNAYTAMCADGKASLVKREVVAPAMAADDSLAFANRRFRSMHHAARLPNKVEGLQLKNFDKLQLSLDRTTTEEARALSQRSRTTEFVVWLACWGTALRQVGQSDLAIPLVYLSGREGLVNSEATGCFARAVPVPLKASESLDAGLRETIRSFTDSLKHADVALHELESWKGAGDSPFQLLIIQENQPRPADIASGGFEYIGCREPSAFPCTVRSTPGEDGQLGIELSLNEADISPAVGRALLEAFSSAVQEITRSTIPSRNRSSSFLGIIANRATSNSSEVAVCSEELQLTYQELWSMAEMVAANLHRRGIREGEAVAIRVARSTEQLPLMLGVFLAGAVYVPIDVNTSDRRSDTLFQQCEAALAVGEQGESAFPNWINPDSLMQFGSEVRASRLKLPDTGQLAYIMFTSGSTGVPNAVEVEHGALDNLLSDLSERLAWDEKTRLLAVTRYGFDISLLELLGPLLGGGVVIVAGEGVARNGEALARLADHHRATDMQATPSGWQVLLESGWRAPQNFTALCGGEAMPPQIAKTLLSQGTTVWNLYGPTETTIWSMAYQLTAVDANSRLIPIGWPISNTTVLVLNEAGEEVEPGSEGRLFIGGRGLARGYRNECAGREKFVCLPGRGSSRWFDTGDRVVPSSEGLLTFLGRFDHQLKLRGQRIEPGEVEAALLHHDGITQAVVVGVGDPPHALTAFYSTSGNASSEIEPQTLRNEVRDLLPEEWIPSTFRKIDQWPLNINGKIDRKELVTLQQVARTPEVSIEGASSELDQVLCSLVAELLDLGQLHIDDDFFAIGGDSITAMKLVAQARARGMEINLNAVFELRTLRLIAGSGARVDGAGVGTLPSGLEATFPLTPSQSGLLVRELATSEPLFNSQCILAWECAIDEQELQRRWIAVTSRHPVFERVPDIQPSGAYWRMHDAPFPWSVSRCVSDTELTRLREREYSQPFDLTVGPLFRLHFVEKVTGSATLLFTYHHLLLDGWSRESLLREVFDPFDADHSGTASDFDHLLRLLSPRPEIDGGWLRQLGELSADSTELTLPESRGPFIKSACKVFSLSQSEEVRSYLKRQRLTLGELFCSLWAIYLGDVNQVDDVLFGCVVSTRPEPFDDGPPPLGMFVATLPIRVKLAPNRNEVFDQVRANLKLHRQMPPPELSGLLVAGGLPGNANLGRTIVSIQNYGKAYCGDGSRLERPIRAGGSSMGEHDAGLVVIDGDQIEIEIMGTWATPDAPARVATAITQLLSQAMNAIED